MTDTSGRVILRAGGATDTGRVRANNQDSYAVLPEPTGAELGIIREELAHAKKRYYLMPED